jgi:Ca2+-transporting ATPase
VEDVVVGDHAVAEEGSLLAADGVIVQSNDFSVNESILTGRSLRRGAQRGRSGAGQGEQGHTSGFGLAVYRVTAVGKGTQLGKISTSLAAIEVPPTPLQQQITRFVRNMAIVGMVVFLAVWAVAYARSGSLLDSLLTGLTLAMSILPEEIPVAFATFLALGAWRLAKQGVIVKRSTTVETLGSATVICTDKTGTITENRMSLAQLFVQANGRTLAPDAWSEHPKRAA